MIGRSWDARFEDEHLVLERRRLLPWPKAEARRIRLAAIVEVRLAALNAATRRARVLVQTDATTRGTSNYRVAFAPDQWVRAGVLAREQAAGQAVRRGQAREPTSSIVARQRPDLSVEPLAATPQPATERRVRSTSPGMRASDGKRAVWLWAENGKIHASLSPVGTVSPRRLDPAGVAHLLLADTSRTMPAIRALTGIDDDQHALACLRSWHPDRAVVHLAASDLAGRRTTKPLRRPAGANPDGGVRTVSGGLPSLGKRHR